MANIRARIMPGWVCLKLEGSRKSAKLLDDELKAWRERPLGEVRYLTWWAPCGFAAIPTAAIDPPLPTASLRDS